MDPRVRDALVAMGTGGTTEMAVRVVNWIDGGGPGAATGLRAANIVGRTEIADMAGMSRARLAKVIAGDAAFPAPYATVDDGKVELYDREHVQAWIDGNPDIVGGST